MPQVYAVVYHNENASQRRVLGARKLARGRFFGNKGTLTGTVYKAGKRLNGGGEDCLPGGKLNPSEKPEEGALREFEEETGLSLTGLYDAVTVHDFTDAAGKVLYHGVYFRVPDPNNYWGIGTQSTVALKQAAGAAAEINTARITRYGDIFMRFPACPADDELDWVDDWNIADPKEWHMISGWQNTPGMEWYYEILDYFRQHVTS